MGFLQTFQHLLPRGAAWRITVDKTLRQFFEGLSEQPEAIRTWIDLIWFDIFPDTTREIAEFEAQFGLVPNVGDDTATRRARLNAAWSAQGGQDPAYLQAVLQAAGFDLYVHDWWESALPYVVRDPRDYTEQPLIGTTQASALASQPQCSAGGVDGNGDALTQWQCNDFLANEIHYLVNHNLTRRAPPRVPDDPRKWPHVIYLGPEVLDTETLVYVPAAQRQALERLALKLCPTQDWIVLRTVYNRLQDLGTMLGLWRADWAGNTIGAGPAFDTFQNIITPGTNDFTHYPLADKAGYEALGWNGVNAAANLGANANYRCHGLAPSFDGTTQVTIAVAVEYGVATDLDGLCQLKGSGDYHWLALESVTHYWQTRRANASAYKYATSAVEPSGFEIIISSFNGLTCDMWRNGVKIVDAADLDKGSVEFDEFWMNGGAAQRIGLLGIYSTAFSAEQAADAYTLIAQDFPPS